MLPFHFVRYLFTMIERVAGFLFLGTPQLVVHLEFCRRLRLARFCFFRFYPIGRCYGNLTAAGGRQEQVEAAATAEQEGEAARRHQCGRSEGTCAQTDTVSPSTVLQLRLRMNSMRVHAANSCLLFPQP